jgi:hypothetical protein
MRRSVYKARRAGHGYRRNQVDRGQHSSQPGVRSGRPTQQGSYCLPLLRPAPKDEGIPQVDLQVRVRQGGHAGAAGVGPSMSRHREPNVFEPSDREESDIAGVEVSDRETGSSDAVWQGRRFLGRIASHFGEGSAACAVLIRRRSGASANHQRELLFSFRPDEP